MSSIRKAAEAVGGQTSLALLLGVSSSAVNQWISGHRPIPAERCPAIELATNGAVRCEELRPDVEWSVLRAPVIERAEKDAQTGAPAARQEDAHQ
jgi:DNA-binding transcriptional regulator YdaS (Cro superfamily)